MSVDLEVVDHIATITLDRPPVNALSSVTLRELTAAFREVGASRDAHVAVLQSTGEKVFSAGADLADSERKYTLREPLDSDTADDIVDPGRAARECFEALYECSVPVIAKVHGITLGAGLALVACADIIVASERARFGLPEILVGVLGGGRFLQRLVGIPKTRSMFYTGRQVEAAELYRLGAIEAVVPHEELDSEVEALAREIAAKSPIALRLGKQSLNRAESMSLLAGYHLEQDYTARISGFSDSREARDAWRENRPPSWGWK